MLRILIWPECFIQGCAPIWVQPSQFIVERSRACLASKKLFTYSAVENVPEPRYSFSRTPTDTVGPTETPGRISHDKTRHQTICRQKQRHTPTPGGEKRGTSSRSGPPSQPSRQTHTWTGPKGCCTNAATGSCTARSPQTLDALDSRGRRPRPAHYRCEKWRKRRKGVARSRCDVQGH
jgi:hypothetical protein